METHRDSYELVGQEYYNDDHATCRNFEAATENFFRNNPDILDNINTSGVLLDIGSGKGMTDRYLGSIAGNLVQLDASSSMLSQAEGLKVHGSALALPFQDESFDTISAFLYDPFNTRKFEQEIARTLKPEGTFIGTLPHFQWASTFRYSQDFRNTEFSNNTYFTLQDGTRVEEPSYVSRNEDIKYNLWRVGFDKVKTFNIPASYVDGRISRPISDTAWSNDTRKPYERLNILTVVKASHLDKTRAKLHDPPFWIREIMTQFLADS